MPPVPSRKRQKTEPPASAYPNTRASSSNPPPLAPPPPPPPPAADTAMHHDSDQGYADNGDDDDEPFEYDSECDEPDVMVLDSPASAPAAGPDDDDDDKDGGDEGEDQLASDSESDGPVDTLVLSDSDDAPPPEPRAGGGPAPTSTKGAKGKPTARKQFALDVQQVHDRFATNAKALVQNFKRDEGDDAVRFALEHPKFPRGLRISLLFPELGGYPLGHEVVAFTEHEEVPDEVSVALQEVSQLPKQADRSLNGLVEFLVHRIVQGEANPWANQPETDEDEYAYEDELENLEASMAKDSELFKALRTDFKQLLDAGYRPGFTRLSELDLVVSVAKKVNLLDVPARALQAWDSKLITGKVVYLVLLVNFGARYPVDLDNQTTGQCRFKVGVSPRYKPVRTAVAAAFRAHSSNPYTKDEFEAISLSAPLDALLNDKLGEILHVRRSNERIGWAGAEQHCFEAGRSDDKPIDRKLARAADKAELEVSQTLPQDPMASLETAHNFPLLAFSYLIRRFVMCPRFCLNCYKRCDQVITALKPFVCESPLCLFQLIALGLGPSLEHEITTNTASVDLLVQLTYIAAKENGLKGDLLPVGLELKVPKDLSANVEAPGVPATAIPAAATTTTAEQETTDLDTLGDDWTKCLGVAHLINELPPISEMRVWLLGEDMTDDERLLNRTRKLVDMRDGAVSISAWRLLRWIVASNTSYLKLIEEEDELIQGIGKDCRQFRLVVGSPAKEHLLAESVKTAQAEDTNAQRYPTLFAFHGSSVKNWSSILRQGLHFRETINGRAYGHGVYFAKDGSVSLGHYAAPAQTVWKNAEYHVSKLAAICEITNLPDKFVSQSPYFVVNQLDWIQARYLIAQASNATGQVQVADAAASASAASKKKSKADALKTISLDPKHPLTIGSTKLIIPDVGDKLTKLEASLTDTAEELNGSDTELLEEPPVVVGESGASSQSAGGGKGGLRTKLRRGTSSLGGSGVMSPTKGAVKGKSKAAQGKERAVVPPPAAKEEPDTFEPADATRLALVKQIPPPSKPSRGAMSMIQKEMRAMLKAQKDLGPTQAGFYFDPERSDDNAFNWIIELPRESFEEGLPLRKDMDARDVKSILMEIRFGDTFPFSPPFFRVVHPRFLPFAHGGGGHVTAGGSICMAHLLTTDGWSSVYTIEAILLQIRMAMSNLEPKPARLDQGKQWDMPYTMEDAIAGFRRAAQAHGWQVPAELETFAAQG